MSADKQEAKFVTIQDIWQARNEYAKKFMAFRSSLMFPEYVMMHPKNKAALIEESLGNPRGPIKRSGFEYPDMVFGMKIIWTVEVGENDVICTVSARNL